MRSEELQKVLERPLLPCNNDNEEYELGGILFKNAPSIYGSAFSDIVDIVKYIEGEEKKVFVDYKIIYNSEKKKILDLGVATFLIQYKSEIDKTNDKNLFEKLYNSEGDKDGIERVKFDGEFDYKGKFYMIISPKRPMGAEYDDFLELISIPDKYLERIGSVDNIKEKVNKILGMK